MPCFVQGISSVLLGVRHRAQWWFHGFNLYHVKKILQNTLPNFVGEGFVQQARQIIYKFTKWEGIRCLKMEFDSSYRRMHGRVNIGTRSLTVVPERKESV